MNKPSKLKSAWEKRRELWAKGDELWRKAVMEEKGNTKMQWKNWNSKKQDYECHLPTGEVFKP